MKDKFMTLFLMTQKGYEVLNEIINLGLLSSINNVVIGTDSNIIYDYSSDIEDLCKKNNITYCFRNNKFNVAEYAIAISWRWIINTESKLIVFHDSILPKYRGFAPLVNSLINFEPFIGVSALFASENYDEGDLIFQESIKVQYPIKISDAIDLISPLYVNLSIKILKELEVNSTLNSFKQDHSLASFSLWRDEEDYHINWNDSSEKIHQFILSVGYPYKGAYTLVENEVIRIVDSLVIDDVNIENRDAGKLIFLQDNFPVIVCGKGLLKILKMKDENNNDYTLKKFRVRFK